MRQMYRIREVMTQEGLSGVMKRTRRKLAGWIDPTLVMPPPSPETDEVKKELDSLAAELRQRLASTSSVIPDNETTKLIKRFAPWYQFIEFPDGLNTTMDSSWAVHDGAKDNSLASRLTPQESSRLRPLPKWMFIKSRLPPIEGNSVLELGSNCGFFSFEFAKRGASHVTGIEAIREYLDRSEAVRSHLGLSHVKLVQMDWCNDPPIEQHDIVFSSEVVGHLIFPFLGLYRLLAAARKYLVLDLGVHWAEKPTAHFDLMLGYTRYHAFSMSDSLLTDYFVRCGIPLESIRKHPYGGRRCLYVVDVAQADLRATLISSDDPLWSGKFSFDSAKGAAYHG